MIMYDLLNRAKEGISSTGTTALTLNGTRSGNYQTWTNAGAATGVWYPYLIEQGSDSEWGLTTYSSSGPTLGREVVIGSIISGSSGTTKITVAAGATVACVEVAESNGLRSRLNPIQMLDFTNAGAGLANRFVPDLTGHYSANIQGFNAGHASAAGYATDGSTDYIDAVNACGGLYSFSIAARFKSTSTGSSGTIWQNPCIFGQALNASGYDGGVFMNAGKVGWWASPNNIDVGSTSATVVVNDGAFHVAVLVYDAGSQTIKLYSDGVDLTAIDYSGTISLWWGNRIGSNWNSSNIWMGRINNVDFGGGPFGSLAATFSQLRCYDYALTSTQVAALTLTTLKLPFG
jgi:hypothetical protein